MSSIFQTAADRLGLQLLPPDAGYITAFEMSGHVAGHVVRVRRDPMMRQMRTEVYFRTPFDLGLRVAPAGQPSFGTPMATTRAIGRVVGRILGRHDMHIGDAQLDDAFDIHGDEERRVAPLLEAARGALLVWYESEVGFDICDAHVSVRRYFSMNWGDGPDTVGADVAPALDLAQRLEAVRASLPVAAALAPHAEALRAFAHRHGIELSTTPLAAWGRAGTFGFLAHAARVAPESFELEMSLGWGDGARSLGGTLRSAKRSDGAGEASFDQAFTVTGSGLSANLPQGAREELLALRRAGHDVLLDDQGLHLKRPLAADPYPFEQAADQAAAVMLALDAALRHPAAYR